MSGQVAYLITTDLEAADVMEMRFLVGGFAGIVVLVLKGKIRLNRKTPATPRGVHDSLSSTSLEEVASGLFRYFHPRSQEGAL